jgi:UMF1 family MFS transporter
MHALVRAVLSIGDAKAGFWIAGLFVTLFVRPVQAASRSFLALAPSLSS